jgi:hypothetical protein
MAVSLGWPIIIACLGVGFPLQVLIAVRGIPPAIVKGSPFKERSLARLGGSPSSNLRLRTLFMVECAG